MGVVSKGPRPAKRKPLSQQAGVPQKRRPDRVAKVHGEEWQQVDPPGMDEGLKSALYQMNPKQVALFSAWVINGRNIRQAARTVGYSQDHAYDLFNNSPAFREAKSYLSAIVLMEDQEWIDCLPQARQTLRSLLIAKDEKVRYLAAKDIVDRAEGKPVARVDMTVRDERPSLTDGQMQLAFSLMQHSGIGFAEAVAWIRDHPDEAQVWIAANATKQLAARNGGREVATQEADGEDARGSRINAMEPEGVARCPRAPAEPRRTNACFRKIPPGFSSSSLAAW